MLHKKQLILLNFICIAAYILGAYIGHLFILAPIGASPIWPPAGIAFAMFLLYRHQVLPGIFLGSLIAQTYIFFNGSSASSIVNSLLLGSFISVGVCLQAVVGVYLIKRFVGENNPLIEDFCIIKFLTLSSVVACFTAACFGSIALFYSQIILASDLLSTWATWWIGDSIGVLIVTPLILIFLAEPHKLWKSRRNYVFYPLSMLLALVVVIFYYGNQQESSRIKTIFNYQTNLLHNTLANEVYSHIEINQILKSYFDNTDVITSENFQHFVKTILKQHDSVAAIEWIPYITTAQRAEFEDSLQIKIREADANHKMMLATEREYYFPIAYVEPLEGNERALGFDIASNPTALQNLLIARDSGNTAVTEKLALVQDKGIIQGIVVYSPIYHKRSILFSTEQKRAALRGFVANVFRIDIEIKEIMEHIPNLQVNFEIKENNTIIYSNFSKMQNQYTSPAFLNIDKSLVFANRFWNINYKPSTEFINTQKTWTRWWIVFGCFLFTGLTGVSLLLLTGRTLRTEELVKLRTEELSKEISEREKWNDILQAIASSTPLNEVLEFIVKITENSVPGMICSILLLDKQKKQLIYGAKGSLPQFYTEAIHEMSIDDKGFAETIVNLKQRLIIQDIKKYPYWKNFSELAEKAGLVTCWLEPVCASNQDLLAVIAIYCKVAKTPNDQIIENIENLSQLVSLAIEKKTTDSRVSYLAFYDSLTNLPNRRLLYDRLHQELARVERHNNYGALMFLDLDHFKTLNDSLGHHIGDELLIQVAERLKECVREEDTIARLGGDEFVVLLRTKDLDSSSEQVSNYALTIAKRIQNTLYIPYSLKGYEYVVTSSIGITLFGENNNDIEALFKQADTAMYAAKNKGRNTFSFYNYEMAVQVDKRLQLEAELRNALQNSQFVLYYQSQHDAQEHIVGAEAFLRWHHPFKGMIPLADFMSACEENGLILDIGEWALNSACQQLIDWPMLEHLSLNLSARQFHHPGFIDQVEKSLREYQLSPRTLMFEITEEIIVKDIKNSIKTLNGLQNLGIRVAIDDFGIGYSSLSDLRNLPINQLKIDQTFTRDICINPDVAVIVEAMLMIAKHLGLHIVAEGVENIGQLSFLQQRGCQVYQGYYFSKPLPAEDFSLLLAKDFNNSIKSP